MAEKDPKKAARRTVWLREKPTKTDNVFFVLGLILLAAGIAYAVISHASPAFAESLRWPFPCPFDSLLHIPCLGCGATRALRALTDGQLAESFLWHPAVPFAAAEALVFLLSQTAGRLSRGRLRMLSLNDVYIYAPLAVIILQWTVKLLTGWRP